jgi:hypothetical protein
MTPREQRSCAGSTARWQLRLWRSGMLGRTDEQQLRGVQEFQLPSDLSAGVTEASAEIMGRARQARGYLASFKMQEANRLANRV